MVSQRDTLREETRYRILQLLARNPDISTREIARRVGISNGSAYYMLKSLVEGGLIKIQNFANAGNKTQYSYILTPEGARRKLQLTVRFLRRKRTEYALLAEEIAAIEAQLKDVPPGFDLSDASDDA